MGLSSDRLYGRITGISTLTIGRVIDLCSGYEVDQGKNWVDFEYEGPPVDSETLVEGLENVLKGAGDGQVDHIDNEEWTMTRWTFSNGLATPKKVLINEVLEKYSQE